MKDTVSSITFKMAMSQSMRNLAKISPALQWLLLCKDTESHHRDKISLSILSCSELQKTNRREVPTSLQGLRFLWNVALEKAYNF